MDDNQNSSTIKLLVDAISRSLQAISDKISNYQPVLNQLDQNIDKELSEINKILFDTQSMSKILDSTIDDFYKRTDIIISNIKELSLKIDNLSTLSKSMESFRTDILTEIKSINQKLDSYKESIEPVITLSTWITKPIGIIIFIISLIFASIAVVNGFSEVVKYFDKTSQSN